MKLSVTLILKFLRSIIPVGIIFLFGANIHLFVNAEEGVDTIPLELTAEYAQSAKMMIEGLPSDLAAVIEQTGSDPTSITDWVRSNIRFESYAGIRKGAEGVLISGSGNSADQALLVASLFEYVGVSAKLAYSIVDGSMLPVPRMEVSTDTNVLPPAEDVEAFAKQLGVSAESIYDTLEVTMQSRQVFLERLWTRTLHDVDTLATALDEAGVAVPSEKYNAPESVEHWWVKTNSGDYDTVLDEALAEAKGAFSIKELPEDLFEMVSVKMWIQARENGNDGADTIKDPDCVLDVDFLGAELFARPILVGNIPLDIESALNELENPVSKEVIDAFAAAEQFQPQLDGPRGLLTGRPFDKTGVRLEIKDGRIESAKKLGGSLGGMFGGGFGGGQSKEKPESQLTAVWLEIELIGSSRQNHAGEPVVIRRDLLKHPKSDTCSLEILSMREILVHADELSDAWVSRELLEHVAKSSEYTKSLFQNVSEHSSSTAASLLEQVTERPHFAGDLYRFGLARKEELLRLREQIAPNTRTTKAHPMVVSMLSGYHCPDGETKMVRGLDILHQAFEVSGNDQCESWKQSLPFAAGVMDTALELVLMEDSSGFSDEIRNSSSALNRLIVAGGSPEIEVSDDLIRLQIKDPSTGQSIASYDINAVTGMSLGMMDGGGQAMTEYAEYMSIVMQLKGCIEFYSSLLQCMLTPVTMQLSGAGVKESQQALTKCVFENACGQISGLVGSFSNIETTWTTIITQYFVDQAWSGVCSHISDQVF